MAKYKFRLSDVDGTVPGVAVLLVVNVDPTCPEDKMLIAVDRFTEDDGADSPYDPVRRAEGLWASTKQDWPGHVHKIAHNERAGFLAANRRTEDLIGKSAWDSARAYWLEYR